MTRRLWVLLLLPMVLCAGVTGKWSGSLVSKGSSGNTVSEPFFLILKEDGSTVLGSAGSDELHQFPLRNGRLEGQQLTFEIAPDSSAAVARFHLVVAADQLEGDVMVPDKNGAETARVSLKLLPPGFGEDPHTLLKNGAEALRNLDYAAANRFFEQALAKQPDAADPLLYLGASYYRQGLGSDFRHPDLALLTKAEGIFRKLIERDSRNVAIRMYVASILYYKAEGEQSSEAKTKGFEATKAMYREVAALDPKRSEAFYAMAAVDYRQAHARLMAARESLGALRAGGPLPDGDLRRDLQAPLGRFYDDAVSALVRAAHLYFLYDDNYLTEAYACLREKAQLAPTPAAYQEAVNSARRWLREARDAARTEIRPDRSAELRKAMESPEIKEPPPFVVPAVDAETDRGGPPAKSTRVNPQDGLTDVWIAPGPFTMGCSPGDPDCGEWEAPHEVKIAYGFWIGQTEVTQAAYERVMGRAPSQFHGAALPVDSASWEDAERYCRAVEMRLPTEAEWEFAARGGEKSSRHGPLDAVAWYRSNSGETTHEVARKQPNSFGLYDMLGNVPEWVADWFQPSYYYVSPPSDPIGPDLGASRLVRGGGWANEAKAVRASHREFQALTHAGFRCAGD